MPISLIDAINSFSAPSSKMVRGWRGLGEIAERGKPKDALDVDFDSNVVNINYKRDGEIA